MSRRESRGRGRVEVVLEAAVHHSHLRLFLVKTENKILNYICLVFLNVLIHLFAYLTLLGQCLQGGGKVGEELFSPPPTPGLPSRKYFYKSLIKRH